MCYANYNMGICLDTEQSDGAQAFEDSRDSWATPRRDRSVNTPPEGRLPLHNGTNVQFETPKVPVIFVLGGPGSGKVTHCDNLTQEKKGIAHINMTDLLQQYAVGNDMQDFGLLSSKTVTEVLMLEMKMSPTAKTFLVSGYPRSMRDVVEYSEKIRVVNGVILISWRQKVLERQIDYGAKLGQVVLSLAKMELKNFYKNVMPVAEYFDQSNMLISVNGERHPGDVYKDFRDAVIKILGSQDNPPLLAEGTEATVPVDTTSEFTQPATTKNLSPNARLQSADRPKTQIVSVNPPNFSLHPPSLPGNLNWPSVLWVIGGPGSNKAALCAQAARETGWVHISLGKLLRAAAEPDPKQNREAAMVRESISNGEMVPLDVVMKMVEAQMVANVSAPGVILDGFPRDVTQATEFEAKFKQKPTIILLDCSKLQLGRGRLDDSVTAFRRRLEIFRQMSLPLLKAMDNVGRLTIVDGDTDTVPVQEDFRSVVKEHIEYIKDGKDAVEPPTAQANNGSLANGFANHGHNLVDSADIINKHLAQTGNGVAHGVANGVSQMANGVKHVMNGYGPVKTNGEVNFMEPHI